MLDNDLVKKINTIVNAYIKNDCKTWNIGTSFVNTWIRFAKDVNNKFTYQEFTSAKFLKIIFTRNVLGTKRNQNQQPRYKIQISNKDISCWRKSVVDVSLAAIRQALQEGDAFGFVIYDDSKSTKNIKQFQLLKNINEIFNKDFEDSFHNLLCKIMCKAFISKNTWVKNLGFTMFLTYLYSNKIDGVCANYQITKWVARKTPSKGNEENFKYIIFGEKDYVKHIEETYHDTYKKACDILNNKFEFNSLIDMLHLHSMDQNKIFELLLTKDEKLSIEKEITFKNVVKEINNERVKLRKAIIENRWKQKIGNDLDLNEKWNAINCDAAHIFEISQIQEEAKRKIYNQQDINLKKLHLDYLISYASDFNNGLLLKKQVHNLFDRDILRLTNHGEITFNESDKKIVEDAFGFKIENKIFIKESVLNAKMLDYISKR